MPVTFKVADDMDADYMASIRPDLDRLANSDDDVVLDVADVTFIDSSGIGGMVFLYKRLATRGRKLRLDGLTGQPLQMLQYLRLTELLLASRNGEAA
ncbi:MAG: STAS domain-containing protein [Beijerinckiaceae bacterium]|nr:STAS domain-containing protein [Beijerinckiaceae bacterium]